MGLLVVNSSLEQQLTELVESGGYLYEATVALFKSDTEIEPGSELADFTLADFPGYEPFGPVAWGSVAIADDAALVTSIEPATFAPSVGTDQTIYGWLLLTTGNSLVGGERFTPPRRVIASADRIAFDVRYTARSQI